MSEPKPDYWTENGKGYARTIDLACLMLSIRSRTLREWLAQGCPGEPGRYCPPEIVEWAKANKWSVDIGDPELSGGDSPALEEYRRAKAALARLDLAEREGELVRVDAIRDVLMAGASLLRGAGEQLRRQFGNDALGILNEALDELDRLIEGIGGEGDG